LSFVLGGGQQRNYYIKASRIQHTYNEGIKREIDTLDGLRAGFLYYLIKILVNYLAWI